MELYDGTKNMYFIYCKNMLHFFVFIFSFTLMTQPQQHDIGKYLPKANDIKFNFY